MAKISFQISAAPGILNDLIAVIYKSSASSAEIDRIPIPAPHNSPQNVQFNNLDPVVYIVKIHETPDGTTLGTLRHDWWQDADTGQILFERRFYKVDGPGTYDPASTASPATITDPYFSGKTISGVFQEGYRYLIPGVEWNQVSGGSVEFAAGISNEPGQVWSVEITYTIQNNNATQQAPFTDFEILTTHTTLNNTHYNKTLLARATGPLLIITTPPLSSIPEGKGFKIVHDGGNAVNTIFQLPSGEIIRFLGEDRNDVKLNKGEYITVIKKVIDGTDYLIDIDRDGQWARVGEIIEGREVDVNGITPTGNGVALIGTEYDLSVFARLKEYIDGLPSNQIVDYATFEETATIGGQEFFTKKGFFARDLINNKVKVPDLRNQTIRYLANLGGADSSRFDNIPGGYQHHQVGEWNYSGHIMQKSGTANKLVVLANINDVDLGRENVNFNSAKETRGQNNGFIPILLI